MSKRISILTSGPLCRNPRVLKEARSLSSAGYTVTVLAIAHDPHFEARDAAILEKARFHKIVLDRMGSNIPVRIVYFFERLLTWILLRGAIAHPARLGPYHALLRLARRHTGDLIIAHTELPLIVAAQLNREGRRVAADLEDWHSQDLLSDARLFRPLQLLTQTERTLLTTASYVTTTSQAMAEALAAHYGTPPPKVVYNAFPLSGTPAPLPRQQSPSFVWLSQTIGPGRGLEQFLAAWNLTTQNSQVCLVGQVDESFRESLLSLLDASHRLRLHFQPTLPPSELPLLFTTHDFGLALEPDTPANKNLTVSNKIFHYLDAGLAIVATPTAGQREVFDQVPCAALLDDLSDPKRLATQLDAVLQDHKLLRQMGTASRQAAETMFNWNQSETVLLAAVATALNA
ncbi:glycosyltransferase [Synoicihabitans lomoniglobus]|uniref:Glycosyltransferase n=1 Tax=Synoicihabitans lomoniglobus TaxID=2909285 RepID=A0AAF0I851_9BACT|nr:glycosyltransferase [Opitutaceae bacterium LMO-M01]WED67336.1 glycosyltransferase [Opitutaceae bacterium LMO-M01]